MRELLDISRVAIAPDKLSECFIRAEEVDEPSEWEVQEDDKAAEHLFTFAVELLGSRYLHCSCLSWTFPWRASALLSEDPVILNEALRQMEIWWECLQNLDDEAEKSLAAMEFRRDLCWPLWEWPRELLLHLREYEFLQVPYGHQPFSFTPPQRNTTKSSHPGPVPKHVMGWISKWGDACGSVLEGERVNCLSSGFEAQLFSEACVHSIWLVS